MAETLEDQTIDILLNNTWWLLSPGVVRLDNRASAAAIRPACKH